MTTITTRAQAFTTANVVKFHGHDVENGEVSVSNEAYVDFLNEIYGDVQVCGNTYGSGDLLEAQDPVAFRCGKNDYESSLQTELEDQLSREDDSQIEFEIDPDDIEEEDESDDE